jgi:superoxide dismutase
LAFDTWEHASYQYKNVKVDAFAALWLMSYGAPG